MAPGEAGLVVLLVESERVRFLAWEMAGYGDGNEEQKGGSYGDLAKGRRNGRGGERDDLKWRVGRKEEESCGGWFGREREALLFLIEGEEGKERKRGSRLRRWK